MKRTAAGRVLLSALAAVVTLTLTWGISRFPYSTIRDRVTDILAWPGGLVAQIFYPAGVHTGSGSPGWGGLVLWANVAFYFLFWFCVLTILSRRAQSGRELQAPSNMRSRV